MRRKHSINEMSNMIPAATEAKTPRWVRGFFTEKRRETLINVAAPPGGRMMHHDIDNPAPPADRQKKNN